MSIVSTHDQSDFSDGIVQLRFSDADGHVKDINAAEFAEVLQGLVELTSQMAKAGAFGEGMPPELRVRPPKEGSFIIEALLQYAATDPMGAIGSAMTAGGVLVGGFNLAVKKLRGAKPTDMDYLPNGNVKLVWAGGGVDEVSPETWNTFKSLKSGTRKSLRKILAPLSDDVESLEVREGSVTESTREVLQAPPVIVLDRSDYRETVIEVDEESEEVVNFEAEAQLRSIEFRPGEKWRVQTLQGTRQATMEDTDFLLELDRGMALHKNDIFDVKIRETRTTKNGRTSKDWALTEVKYKRRGQGDGDGEPPFEEPSTDA